MEGTSSKRECEYEGQTFIHGTERCELSRCNICIDGEWTEKKVYGPYAPVP